MSDTVFPNFAKRLLSQGEHAGFRWFVLHHEMGFRCGYVLVPPGHPWHGKDYFDIKLPKGVHGGLTFGDIDPADNHHWFGFDCHHAGDAKDPSLPGSWTIGSSTGVVRTTEYVEAECRKLCEQARDAAPDHNASLSAAAPSLYAALLHLVELREMKRSDPVQYARLKPTAWQKAKEALAEATPVATTTP